MAVPVPLLDTLPNQPTVASKVQAWLVSCAQNAGSTATFTTTVVAVGTTVTGTATAIIDPSGAAVGTQMTTTVGQYSLVCTVGTLQVAQCAFVVQS